MHNNFESKEFFENELDLRFKGNNVSCFPDFHFHDHFEIFYCIDGAKQYLIDDSIYSLDPGDLFIINNFEIHKPLRDPNGDYRRVVVIFSPDKIKEINAKHSIALLSCFVSRKGGTHNKISLNTEQQKIFLDIAHRIHNLDLNDFGAQAMMESYYIELLVYVNRWFRENFSTEKKDESYGFNPTVKAIIDYTNDNFTNNITLESLAEEFHLNKHYMCQLFKNTTGTTIHRYIISRRLSRAKILLHQGHNVTTTSDMCGFQNYTNFIRTFKKHFGVSPQQFSQQRIIL